MKLGREISFMEMALLEQFVEFWGLAKEVRKMKANIIYFMIADSIIVRSVFSDEMNNIT